VTTANTTRHPAEVVCFVLAMFRDLSPATMTDENKEVQVAELERLGYHEVDRYAPLLGDLKSQGLLADDDHFPPMPRPTAAGLVFLAQHAS
jgi:hypothetical protein